MHSQYHPRSIGAAASDADPNRDNRSLEFHAGWIEWNRPFDGARRARCAEARMPGGGPPRVHCAAPGA
eukprot:5150382-Pyramimonas_sp.AAC.1